MAQLISMFWLFSNWLVQWLTLRRTWVLRSQHLEHKRLHQGLWIADRIASEPRAFLDRPPLSRLRQLIEHRLESAARENLVAHGEDGVAAPSGDAHQFMQ